MKEEVKKLTWETPMVIDLDVVEKTSGISKTPGV